MDIKDTSGGKRNVDDLYNFCNISSVTNDSNLFASTFETEIVFESNSNIAEEFEPSKHAIYQTDSECFHDNDVIDFRLEACVKLLDILDQAKAPLYLYKSISTWLKDCMSKDTSFFEQDLYSREKVLKQLEKNIIQIFNPTK